MDNKELDIVIVGTGFSGVYLLHTLRKRGYKVKAIDAASQLGGVWCHNIYPGARVDIEVPIYELNIRELWEDPEHVFLWKEKFPGSEELQAYFRFIDERLDLSKDCVFDSWVESATWDEENKKWKIKTRDEKVFTAKYFLPSVGYAAKPYVPPLKGLETFNGQWTHTAQWPKEGLELEAKRVGIIGTGASGVQVIQTIAPIVKQLTVFQKTPATAVPMQQQGLSVEKNTKSMVANKQSFLEQRTAYWDGAGGSMIARSAQDDTPEQRDVEFSRLWDAGGFSFWTSNYMDLFEDKISNEIIYQWWKAKIRTRLEESRTQQILAPDEPPYAFGTKRVPLEQNYYEAFNLPQTSLVDLRGDPISKIKPEGVLMQSGALFELDILILATGFDISTGSFTQMDIRGRGGIRLSDTWSERTKTYLGVSILGYPNMLFPYGPQSPSNSCNGPLCAEIQGNWIADALDHVRETGKYIIEATPAAEEEYVDLVAGMLKGTLFEGTQSYYFADNIPRGVGQRRQPVFWTGGLPAYKARIEQVAADGYSGFTIS